MYRTIDGMKIRMHYLKQRDPVANEKIINKIKRKIKAIENKGQE